MEQSSNRYKEAMTNHNKIGDVDAIMGKSKITAEYDTWSWYYTELSALRGECSRLGLLVRVNDKESLKYLTIYNAHIISYLNMLSPLVPTKLWEIIEGEWKKINTSIDTYKNQIATVGYRPIPAELILTQDKLYRAALRIAQKLGLGFKTTLNDIDSSAISKSILGE